MRIISGSARGTRLAIFAGKNIRPTSDRVREAVFSILYSRMGPLTGKKVLDLFAGTGAMALEALSRGAADALLVEASPLAVHTIEENARACHLQERLQVLRGSVGAQLSRLSENQSYDLIFLDPPYEKGLLESSLQSIAELGLLAVDGLVCAECAAREAVPQVITTTRAGLVLRDSRTYGSTAVHFYTHPETEDSPA